MTQPVARSAAKTAAGDKPVFAYIASLPHPQGGIAERIDALAVECLPGIQRAVKWGMAYYGVDGVELASLADLDEGQVALWMKQAATMPFVGGKKR